MPDYIDPTNIGQLIDILQSETEGRHFDPTEVQSRLDDLMTAVGFCIPRANMSEEEIDYGLAYDEAEDQQTDNPREKVQHYKNIPCLSGCNPHPLYVGCAVIRQARVSEWKLMF